MICLVTAMTHAATSVDFFDIWMSINVVNVGEHTLMICKENRDSIDDIIEEFRNVMRSHYVAPEITAKRVAELGASKTAELLKEHLPTTKAHSADPVDVLKAQSALKKARSGDFGEILATELTERKLGFNVPVRRLRYKDGRNMALRGDDIVAVIRDREGRLKFLKGESKSRVKLTSTVVKEAAEALDRDLGVHLDIQQFL